MKKYYVYILRCANGSYYTGITNNVERRLHEHQSGIDPHCYTYKRRPVKLVYHHEFSQVQSAIAAEKQLQGWSRKKKEALINGDVHLLPLLSMNKRKQVKHSEDMLRLGLSRSSRPAQHDKDHESIAD